MTWQEHIPHRATGEVKPFYTYTLVGSDGDDYYAAFITKGDSGYTATVPRQEVPPRGKELPTYHYTHDTLQEAKDWCIAELWKRRLS